MNILFVACAFSFGFTVRLIQVSFQASSMVGTASTYLPLGDAWCFLSSCAYGLVCALIVLAVLSCDKKTSTTIIALTLSGAILLADFIKPSRFESETYLDHAIRLIGVSQEEVFHDQWSVAKSFSSLAKL